MWLVAKSLQVLRAGIWLVVLCWALITSPAQASGFPDFDPSRERVVQGRVRASDSAVSAKATTRGTWRDKDGKLSIDPAETSTRFWMPNAAQAELADGLLRVRIEPGARADFGILFRTTAPTSEVRELSGYELVVTAKDVRFHRWDRGKILPAGEAVAIRRLKSHKVIEIVIYLIGPQLVAHVYDGNTLKRLATLTVHETTYSTGRVGLRVGKRQDGGGLTLLSVMDAAASHAKPTGSLKHGSLRLYGLEADPGTTPFGNTRFAFIPHSEIDKLSRDLRRTVQTTIAGGAGLPGVAGTLYDVVFTTTVGLERMRRSGATITAVDSNVPWRVFDRPYRARRGKPPTPTKRGFRLDQSYKNPKMVEELLLAYHNKYPDITHLIELGRTHQGRPIWAIKISDNPEQNESEPSVLLNGGHHASELLSVEYPLDAVAQLLEGYGRKHKITAWIDNMEIYVVPLVNADGNHMFIEHSRFAGRKNARDTNGDGYHDPFEGIDLNRNYTFGWGKLGSSGIVASKYYRGARAGSEPESQAMMKLADRMHFAAAISFHTIGTAIFSPYIVANGQNPDPDVAFAVAMELAGAAEQQPNGRFYEVRPNKYPVAGSDQDWYLHEHGTLAYIVEGTHHNPPMSVRGGAVASTRALWQTLLDRVHSGPRISGHVRDASGRPLTADISVEQIKTRAGERWTSRAHDGRFDQLMIGPGKYTVKISAPGYTTQHKRVRVRSRPVEIVVSLTASS